MVVVVVVVAVVAVRCIGAANGRRHGPTGSKEIPEATKRFLDILYTSVERYYNDGLQDFEMRDKVVEDLAEFSSWRGMDEIGRVISFVYQEVEAAEFE